VAAFIRLGRKHGHQQVPMTVQAAIIIAVIVLIGGYLLIKGRRAGI
jgi:uncharacterized membrane protein YjjP (DUF1212 family)